MMSLRMEQGRPLLRHLVSGKGGYNIPRTDGRLVIGSTMESVGFDNSNTASGVMSLLSRASDIIPSVESLPIVEMWAGLRPRTPDGAPILGPTSVEGLILATGHFHIGVVLAPVTADYIGRYTIDDKLADEVRPFGVARFGREALSQVG
jgi:glycine oxidase